MNGIKYLLDTNIIIGMYRHSPAVIELMQTRQARIGECAYSVITRMELLGFMGITATEEQAINSLLARMPCLGLTADIEAATIQLKRRQRLKLPDAIIKATANEHGLELLTLDKQLAGR